LQDFTISNILEEDNLREYVTLPLATSLYQLACSLTKGYSQFIWNENGTGDMVSLLLHSLNVLALPPPLISPTLSGDPHFRGLLLLRWQSLQLALTQVAKRELERMQKLLFRVCFGTCFRLVMAELKEIRTQKNGPSSSSTVMTIQNLHAVLESKIQSLIELLFAYRNLLSFPLYFEKKKTSLTLFCFLSFLSFLFSFFF
jgi:hypothetical protein